jgi:hypothetical protein
MASPDPSRKNVSKIKSSLLRPAQTSHFECWFNPPPEVRDWIVQRVNAGVGKQYDAEFISLSCSEASLPGSSLATHEINNDFSGVTERHAYRRLYDDRADFTFYVDHDYSIITFFENWISYIVNEQFAQGLESNQYTYRVNYPNLYRTTIYLNKFERDYNLGKYLRYRFLQAYPLSITSMPVSYDNSQLLKCTVSFSYTRYAVSNEYNKNFDSDTTNAIKTPQQQAAGNVVGVYGPRNTDIPRIVELDPNRPTLAQLNE